MQDLQIIKGINYECSGCGTCCSGWAVPMTQADYERVSRHDWGEIAPERYAGKDLFRPMKAYEMVGMQYTHAIKPAPEGHCPFLVDKLCFIHGQFGAEEKPSICRLFPYCFNETPSGVYATVSFFSMAVIWNTGKSLIEQKDYLESKWVDYQRLYPGHHPNWSSVKLASGIPMTWDQYMEYEKRLLEILDERTEPFEQRLLKGSDYLMTNLPGAQRQAVEGAAAKLKRLDRHLLVALHKLYYPVKQLGRGEGDFNLFRFLYQVAFQGTGIAMPAHNYKLEQLSEIDWPAGDKDMEDLLYRYFYSRIFGKYYFGAGFGQLSLIAGFHHLILAYCLMKLQAKGYARQRGASTAGMLDLVASLRQMEKRLGETMLDGYAAATYELLMFSPNRIKRIISYI